MDTLARTVPSANFYPRPPRGGRRWQSRTVHSLSNFYPRPPRGGRQLSSAGPVCHSHHFYPRPPRGGRRRCCSSPHQDHQFLSTPSARRATVAGLIDNDSHVISIHALREEGDCIPGAAPADGRQFLSTPSARRATHPRQRPAASPVHFYPRPPRGGRLLHPAYLVSGEPISIHALREEGDILSFLHLVKVS